MALHLAARGWRAMGYSLVVAMAVGIIAGNRAVFLPLTLSATIQLNPMIPYLFVVALVGMMAPRLFTLDLTGWRERGVRLTALLVAMTVSAGALGLIGSVGVGEVALLFRNFLAFMGALLLLAALLDAPMAALVLGVTVVIYAYAGSERAGEVREWAWLLRGSDVSQGWGLALLLVFAGLAVDISRGTATTPAIQH